MESCKRKWLENYKQISYKYSESLESIVKDKTINIQEAMDKFDKVLNRIKFKAFGKVTINNSKKENNKEKEGYPETNLGEEQEEVIAKKYLADQEKIVEEELNKIKATHKGKVSQVWAIRKKVVGGKKSKVLPTAITNPTTNKLVVNRKEIKISYTQVLY